MLFVRYFKNLRLLPLLALPLVAWLLPPVQEKTPEDFSADKVNLALRRTADGLLRASGDSTSRIPAIEQAAEGVWRVRLEQPFEYEQLPALLQASLDLHGIRQPYEVAVRRCDDAVVVLGYHQLDFLQKNDVPCNGRDVAAGCQYIEIAFLENSGKSPFWAGKTAIVLLIWGGMAGIWFFRRKRPGPAAPDAAGATEWLEFGNSRLDVAGQLLICGGAQQTLTFREAKLLRLFAASPGRLLERDLILRQVWADEGVLVGRSIDVFVSRLRKKLSADPSVGIVAVHGVGYRLETGKTA